MEYENGSAGSYQKGGEAKCQTVEIGAADEAWQVHVLYCSLTVCARILVRQTKDDLAYH